MNISDIIKKYYRTRETGLLSVKVVGQSHLLKIYFADGEIIHLSMGTCKNNECFNRLTDLTPAEHFFVKGVKAPGTLGAPITETLLNFLDINKDLIDSIGSSSAAADAVQTSKVSAAEREFLDIIGPIGAVILDSLYSRFLYKKGAPMPSDDFNILIDSLAKELPAQYRPPFAQKYKV
ncbi:MAG: hypothetical protein RBT37_08335 [Dissulfurispiraceae bacterium]|jgi:hypothetical protein|nr:hypothetical protein [Dissulfurispiraceae bacterium]